MKIHWQVACQNYTLIYLFFSGRGNEKNNTFFKKCFNRYLIAKYMQNVFIMECVL